MVVLKEEFSRRRPCFGWETHGISFLPTFCGRWASVSPCGQGLGSWICPAVAQRPPHLPGTARWRMCAGGTPLPSCAPHSPLCTPCPGEMPMPQPPRLPGARHGVLSANANNKMCSGKKRKSHLAPLHHSPILNPVRSSSCCFHVFPMHVLSFPGWLWGWPHQQPLFPDPHHRSPTRKCWQTEYPAWV